MTFMLVFLFFFHLMYKNVLEWRKLHTFKILSSSKMYLKEKSISPENRLAHDILKRVTESLLMFIRFIRLESDAKTGRRGWG